MMPARLRIACAMMASAVTFVHPLYAHPLHAPPRDPWRTWTWEPLVVVGIVVGAWLYARGWRAIARRRAQVVQRWRGACFAAGLGILVAALLSPIDSVAAALFSMHMTQHLLLVMIAAPLLILGDAGRIMFWALPPHARRAVPRSLHRVTLVPPALAWVMHVVALWVWHVPQAYEAALHSAPVHALEHATFFVTALLFWRPLIAPLRRRRLRFAPATMYLFAAGLQCTALGALITFARHAWYPTHAALTQGFGLTALEDQQLAGLIMWVPAGIVYLVALVGIAAALRPTAAPPRRATAVAA
jgi:cytochrome c oxidase assembly factor CtaG